MDATLGRALDYPLFTEMSAHWAELRQALIDDLNTRYPFFDGETFKRKRLAVC